LGEAADWFRSFSQPEAALVPYWDFGERAQAAGAALGECLVPYFEPKCDADAQEASIGGGFQVNLDPVGHGSALVLRGDDDRPKMPRVELFRDGNGCLA
jgi:hypothetical protein